MASESTTRLQTLYDALLGAMHDRIVADRAGNPDDAPHAALRAREHEAHAAYTAGLREVFG